MGVAHCNKIERITSSKLNYDFITQNDAHLLAAGMLVRSWEDAQNITVLHASVYISPNHLKPNSSTLKNCPQSFCI